MDFVKDAGNWFALLRTGALAVAIFGGGWLVSRLVHRVLLHALSLRRLDLALSRFVASIVRYLVLAAAVIASLETIGIQTTSLVAILASAGLAIGLALQGSLANFASGVLILFFRHFQLGDKVTIGGVTGVVEDIGLFTSTVISPNNEKIVIPNSSITSGPIVNFSERGLIRGIMRVAVETKNTSVGQVIEVLTRAANRTPGIAPEPKSTVLISDMEDGSLDVSMTIWFKAIDEDQVLHNLRVEVLGEIESSALKLQNRTQLIIHPRGSLNI